MRYQTLNDCRKRIEQLLAEPKFVQMAKDFLAKRKTYNDEMALCNEVVSTDFGNFSIDREKIYGNYFHEKEMAELMIDFYKHLDTLEGNDDSLQLRAVDNLQYLKFVHDPKYRSNCGHNGPQRHINVGIEGSIRDANNMTHEFGHSESENFHSFKPLKDENMREFCTVIIDHIFPEFLKTQRPDLEENLAVNFAESQLLNKSKAKLSLFEGAFLQVMAGNITLDDAMKQYSAVYANKDGTVNLAPVNDLLDRIDKALSPTATRDDEFKPLYETRYLFPQMMSIYAREQYKKNPEEFAKKFKYVILHDCELNEEEALKKMGFPEREKIIEWYKNNIALIIKEQFASVEDKENDRN